jgi:hypothetical protein
MQIYVYVFHFTDTDAQDSRAGILKQSMGARNRVGKVIVTARQATWAGGIHSLESIPGLHKRLKIRAQDSYPAFPSWFME